MGCDLPFRHWWTRTLQDGIATEGIGRVDGIGPTVLIAVAHGGGECGRDQRWVDGWRWHRWQRRRLQLPIRGAGVEAGQTDQSGRRLVARVFGQLSVVITSLMMMMTVVVVVVVRIVVLQLGIAIQ